MASDTITSEMMGVVDLNSEFMGVKRIVLMENAGAAIARNVVSFLGQPEKRNVLVLCGPGNNGGDGMAAARHLACLGANVSVMLLADPAKIRTEEARANYESVKNMTASVRLYVVQEPRQILALSHLFEEAEVIVDAILGTGAKGELPELFRTAVNLANNSSALRVAVDIPTGLDPDTGTGETFFQPSMVVALHKLKPVHETIREKTVVEKIGIPPETEFLAGPGQLMLLLRKTGVSKLSSSRLAYVFGESGPEPKTRELLTSLKGFTAFCDLNTLVENTELRYAVASSRAVLVSSEVNPLSIRPFLPRSQPVILTTPTGYVVNPIYVMWSDKPLLEDFGQKHASYIKDVDELCRKLAAPVYVVGEVDIMSNGVKAWANWLGKPLKQGYFGYAPALVTWFVSAGADVLLSMASTSYLLRTAETSHLENPTALAEHVMGAIDRLA
ncbi:MAG: NAD(P)H-hydrate epimerase [Candidatus Caldarchaeum sp.]|nr:NAD(P)H-hydrate epimerase [Candidatus Caldarchaeum sp.]MCS7133734.1 NAD(P)H-hydrate epimerase [Candidatus Caldarchaeum sp.]MCX8201161.1 NAD(P)H-hydrate epimerase [Candidatus Caldarchaeum sp.]MDW8063102.1 NAD(P)H-hydrate epimerase [Candidatus Caldarchaeum sp.]MDW8435326.1 NAD(P)H-hydrate epimerase [Candidatus Caldarchaeum sp.]